MKSKLLSVIIPVYNNKADLENTYCEIKKVFDQEKINHEILFIDDGSTDGSFSVIESIALKDKNVTVLKLVRNFGQHSATLAGIKQAKGEVIVTIDADLQNDPFDILRLVERLQEGYQVVSGVRDTSQIPFIKFLRSYLINWCIFFITGTRLKDSTSTFKAYNRDIIDSALKIEYYMRFLPVYICWLGGRITEVEIKYRPRKSGKSQYNLFKLLVLFVEWFLLFSSGIKTVILLLIIGFCFLGLSILFLSGYLILMISQKQSGGMLLGYSLFFFFGGINFIVLGIISERIKQLQVAVNKQPLYFIDKIIKKEDG